MIQHTYESASRSQLPSEVWVAADCEEIASAVRSFGGRVVLTDPDAPSGTDRIAEAVASRDDVDIVVNVQGDEPNISGDAIDQLIGLLANDESASMATLATPIRDRTKLEDPACVKVVCDSQGRAIYFSRAAIPHVRDWDDSLWRTQPPMFYQHVGIYAYRHELLLRLAKMERSRLEQLENLEQLRALEAGETILVGTIDEPAVGVDTAEDYAQFVKQSSHHTPLG